MNNHLKSAIKELRALDEEVFVSANLEKYEEVSKMISEIIQRVKDLDSRINFNVGREIK